MKKLYITLFLIIGILSTTYAQDTTNISPCGTAQMNQEYVESLSPHDKALYMMQREACEQFTKHYIQVHHQELYSKDQTKSIQFVIPVVFHIVYDKASDPENISNAQVKDAIKHMNLDYQELNSDVGNTIPYFQSRVANIQIEFKLAKLDPNGNCTNGITRTQSHSSVTGNTNAQMQAVKAAHGNWPGDEYLNIFVAQNIGQFAGFSPYPYSSDMTNGIHVRDTYCGTIGTASMTSVHTLSHEAGHWFNLEHPWGSTNTPGLASNCSIDDDVDDTPVTKGWTTCDQYGRTCPSEDTATYDNVQNFMEYSYCSTMFTTGQKARMWALLNSSIAGRNNLWSASNLAATGVNLPETLCKADFYAPYKVVCIGQQVQFNDLSYTDPTQWNWEFTGGTPATSTLQNPTVTYSQPGVYKVKLTATKNGTSVSTTKNDYIRVLAAPSTLPYQENFENTSTLPNTDWGVENPNNDGKFQITIGAAYSGTHSAKLNNFGQPSGETDALVSAPIDLSTVNPAAGVTLTFKYAYRKRTASNNEKLTVSFSKDCGKTWEVRYLLSNSNLGSATASSSWAPSSQSDWVTVNVPNITSEFWNPHFRTKFEFNSDGGNNFYIDDINVYAANEVSVNTIDDPINNFKVYPNPASRLTNISFASQSAGTCTIRLVNMTGQTVLSQTIQANSGKNLVLLNTSKIDAGVYLVKLNRGNTQAIKRLIIK